MKYYVLLRGKSKKRLKPVMIDELRKVENYKKALQASLPKVEWFDIQPAAPDAKIWRKSATSMWTGYNDSGPKIIK